MAVHATPIFARTSGVKLVNILTWQKGLCGRIGQWAEALYKTKNFKLKPLRALD